jgi:hypothetical protein
MHPADKSLAQNRIADRKDPRSEVGRLYALGINLDRVPHT